MPIHIEWLGPAQFVVAAGSALTGEVTLAESGVSRAMNMAARLLPESWWRKLSVLGVMGAASRFVLGMGRINLTGRTPNGHQFIANPRQLWFVKSSRVIISGVDIGAPAPLLEQARLRDLQIPQKGIFAAVRAFLKTHSSTVDGRIRSRTLATDDRVAS